MSERFFFDTYALIEINKGSPRYKSYTSGIKVILNKLNIMEYILFLMREEREKQIEEAFRKLSRFNVDYSDEDLVAAAKMKFKFAREKLSFVDCIGYSIARRHNARFLTGDEKFKNKDNVEFVKG